jgi:ketosteroid isomerase-like protein
MPNTQDQAAIESAVRALEQYWATLDFKAIRALWDDSAPPLYLAEETIGPARSWEELEKYWGATGKLAKRNRVKITHIRYHDLTRDVVSAFYDMHWDIELDDGKTIGGDNRVCVSFKRTAAGWRIGQYIEAPLAPLLYMRQLYELNTSPDFKAVRP